MSKYQAINKISHYISTALSTLFGYKDEARLELRVALDVGSASTKAKGIIYDVKNAAVLQDLGELFEAVEYQVHLNDNGSVIKPEYIFTGLSKVMKIISQYAQKSSHHFDTIKCSGIATAWARKAKNIEDFKKILNANGIKIKVVSQEEEGSIGYKAAISYCKTFDKDMAENISHVLDVGGGSFQVVDKVTDNNFSTFNGAFGSSNFFKAIREYTMQDDAKPSEQRYLNAEEVLKARDYVYENITKKLQDHLESRQHEQNDEKQVVAIGQFMNKGVQSLIDGDTVHLSKVSELVDEFTNSTLEEAFNNHPAFGKQYIINAQTNLLLLEGIMNGLSVEEIKLRDAKSADYVAFDESFWAGSTHNNYKSFELVDYFAAA